jgi:hypothetical protein
MDAHKRKLDKATLKDRNMRRNRRKKIAKTLKEMNKKEGRRRRRQQECR